MLPVHAVLFDYGMVLSGPASPAAWARMQAIAALDEEALHAAYWTPRLDYDRGTHTGEAYWLAVAEHAGTAFAPEALEALLAADFDLWTDPNQPMIDWAARLQRAGTRTGILSNLGDRLSETMMARLPWLEAFDFRLWSHAVRLAKPERRIYELAADGLATVPAHILFVDDREENIQGALEAGMQAARYTTTEALVAELDERGLAHVWSEGRTV